MLSLSYKTVANHQWNIRQKLDVSNTAQVIRMAMTHGMIRSEAAASAAEAAGDLR
jgi:DNA-binding CsgD family transcriptional regulator